MKKLTKHPEGLDIIEFTCLSSLVSMKEISVDSVI
jgi:hypothetical protein